MLLDLREMQSGSDLWADVCVVGAGAAGVTLARQLRGKGLDIILLESGGLDYEQDTQDLYAGANLGMPYYELEETRLRFFGGTVNIWGGRCVPLDDIDYQHRPWVPHSGWPITAEDLTPYFERLQQDLELGDFEYGERLWRELRLQPPAFDSRRFVSGFWRFDDVKERFSISRCKDILNAPDVRVLLHANAVRIQANRYANGVEHIVLSTLDGRRSKVVARRFVLACGGLENPRLLLTSDDVQASGLGNQHDQVGRYFMEHPHGRAGFVDSRRVFGLWNLFVKRMGRDGVPLAPVLRPSPEIQTKEHILNTAITFKLQRDPRHGLGFRKRLYFHLKHQLPANRTGRRLWHAHRGMRRWLHRYFRASDKRIRVALGVCGLSVMVRAEQAPNPASRVVLSTQRDSLGLRQLNLDWRLSEIDKRTVAVLADLLGKELDRMGLGHLRKSEWLTEDALSWPVDETVGNHPIGGFHHMGTTRMSHDPKAGVVDSQCRVHGYRNLYITGSSVFPTGGWANPTLTLLALTHRLAEHLAHKMKR